MAEKRENGARFAASRPASLQRIMRVFLPREVQLSWTYTKIKGEVRIDNGNIVEFQVNMMITFVLDDTNSGQP